MILSNLKEIYWFLQVSQRVWGSATVCTFLVVCLKNGDGVGGGEKKCFLASESKELIGIKE